MKQSLSLSVSMTMIWLHICVSIYVCAKDRHILAKEAFMKKCFGAIYPDLTRVEYNKDIPGKVFTVRVGSFGLAHQTPELKADIQAWEECRQCELYQSCLDFSNAKLAMRQVLRQVP